MWTHIKSIGKNWNYEKLSLFRCDCGKERILKNSKVKSGVTKSCGCLRFSLWRKQVITHDDTNSREYKIWSNMKYRCFTPTAPNYYLYGGRGIKVCKRWKNSYLAFLQDMGRANKPLSLDRINPNGNYTPTNCRWATPKEQIHNRRRYA